jgi:uncharacterized protein (TIGR02231 family)
MGERMILSLWCGVALAQYKEAAEQAMGLSFDLDEMEKRVAPNAPAAAPPRDAIAQDVAGNSMPAPKLPLEPNSTLDGVVVYRDRALVTRTREIDLPSGSSTVEFAGLPLVLAEESLHASSSGGRIVSVELESGTEVQEGERTEAVRADLRKLTAELGTLRDHIESLLAQREYLQSNLLVAPGGASPRAQPTLDQVRGTLEFLGDSERLIAQQLRADQDKAEELDKKIRPLLPRLDDPFATGRVVRVEVSADKAAHASIALEYQVWGASWSPAYNARYDEKSSKVTLEYYGVVTQGTSEAWTNARLALSTADPAISGDLPVLSTWWLGQGTYDQLAGGAGFASEIDNRGAAQGNSPAPSAPVEGTLATSRAGGAVVFPVDGRRTIAGDGSPQRIPIGDQTFPAVLELSTVPKLVPEVYRRVRLDYNGAAPLLPGPIATFAGADYVGSGSVKTVVPGEELKLAVGTDDQFKVERQLLDRTVEQVNGKKSIRYSFQYRITVSNFSGKASEVLVSDQVPVSQLEKVVVAMGEVTTPEAALPDDPAGLLRWRLNVAPNEKKVIDLAYTVTFPREEEGQVEQELQLMY